MKNFTMTKKIILALFCIVAIVAWSALCKPPQVDVRTEALTVLEQMHTTGMQRLDAKILSFNQQLHDIQAEKAELEQILPQLEKWFAEKKLADYADVPCG